MIRQGWKRAGLALGALLLAVLVGCQAVGGFSLDDMLLKQLDVKSSESSGTFEIALDWDDAALAQEEPEVAAAIEWFRKIQVRIDRSASDEDGNAYVSGALTLSKGEIPFTLQTDKDTVLLDVAGAKRPLVLDMSFGGMMPGLGGTSGEDSGAFEEAILKLVREAGSYLVGHLPNPPTVKVDLLASEPIRGVPTDVTKVHAELNGKELGELIPAYLDALVKDEAGLRQLLGSIVKWAAELPPELQEAFGMEAEDWAPTEQELNETVQEILDSFKEAQEELAAAKKDESWNDIFNEGIQFKTDLYVDRSMHIRKTNSELTLSAELFKDSGIPLKGVTIRSSEEIWNVNGDVSVPAIQKPFNAYDLEDLVELKPFQAVKLFDENSVIYQLLKKDLQIDDQEFLLSPDWGVPYVETEDGDVYLPIRETIEQLGGQFLEYDPATKGIRFYDEATRQTLELKVGSANLLVNDKPVAWTNAVEGVDGLAYAEADDLLGTLHAKYSVVEDEYGDYLVVSRDL